MIILAIPTINGEIYGDAIIIKKWNEIKDYINGKKGEYTVYKIDWFNETVEELR